MALDTRSVVRVTGLKEVANTLLNLFPTKTEPARRILNQTLSAAAKMSIIPIAKTLALQMDASGALAESIKPRAMSRARAARRGGGVVAAVEIVPLRNDVKAMVKYIEYYYGQTGKKVPPSLFVRGIQHGHLQEWGTVKTSAQPFLGPAASMGFSRFIRGFAGIMKQKIYLAVRRNAKKSIKAGFK